MIVGCSYYELVCVCVGDIIVDVYVIYDYEFNGVELIGDCGFIDDLKFRCCCFMCVECCVWRNIFRVEVFED